MKAEIRILKPHEWKQAVQLSDQIFREEDQISMGQAFPRVFSASLSQSHGLFLDETLVSFIGLVPSVVRVGNAELHAFSIGSVLTDPRHRGNGYAGQILQRIYKHADRSEASILFISGSGGIYERSHSYPFGTVYHFTINATAARQILNCNERITLREMASEDWFHFYRLSSARTVRFDQSIWDLADLIHTEARASVMKSHHLVKLAQKENGDVTAFAVFAVPYTEEAKGTAEVIEYGGEPEAIAALLAESVISRKIHELKVSVPFHEDKLIGKLGDSYELASSLGSIRIINPARLIDQLRPWLMLTDESAASGLFARWHGQEELELGNETERLILSQYEAVQLLFSAKHDLQHPFGSLFPVPLPYPGGLNYT